MAKKKSKKRSKSRSGSIDQASTVASSSATSCTNENAKTTSDGGTTTTNGNKNLTAASLPKLKPGNPSSQHHTNTTPPKTSITTTTTTTTDQPTTEKYPIEEDLSIQRHDEETVLTAIYGDDFTLESGAWNCPLYKLRIRPASDVTDHGNKNAADAASSSSQLLDKQHRHHHHHNPNHDESQRNKSCELTLHIQLNQKYPYSVPLVQITNAVGVISKEISELLTLLQAKARECADMGAVMGWEMGQVVEAYLVDCVERRKKEEQKRQDDMLKKVDFAEEDDDDDVEVRLNIEDPSYSRNGVENVANISITPSEFGIMDSDTQRELARQVEALDTAARMRKQRRQRARDGILPSIADKHDEEGSDDDDDNVFQLPKGYDFDNLAPAAFVTTHADGVAPEQGNGNAVSRYQTDFVEIAHLGRGGGGEVVKAINRLDRRVYAIKKIMLEPEIDEDDSDGIDEKRRANKNKWATIQNEKLRREVTTISMMSHKNIVRYYQAWVENPTGDQSSDNGVGEGNEEDKVQTNGDDDESSSSSSWCSSSSSGSSSSQSSSPSQSGGQLQRQLTNPISNYSRSLSLDNFLEHEVDFANPLMFGNGALLGYPPIAVSSDDSPLPQHGQLQSQSHSISDWTGNLQRKKDYGILYIQMEFCKTTMKDMIDDRKLSIDTVWKSLRQILEALVYIHSRNIIHRDLKPANIFIDSEENIRLGDFGLATSNRTSVKPPGGEVASIPESEVDVLYEAIDDISGLLGASSSANISANNPLSRANSITGGVGTTFYMAPEQEHGKFLRSNAIDIYSLGVLLFEMFMLKPLGCTYMERADILTALRGETRSSMAKGLSSEEASVLFSEEGEIIGDWQHISEKRFPESFRKSVPINAQKIILWCLEAKAKHRPSAKQLLTCDLLPRKVELEEKYLNEVLQTLSNQRSEQSYHQILTKLFERNNPTSVLTTYDSEISIKASKIDAHLLVKSLNNVKGSSWSARDMSYSSPMSAVAVAAAISALGRAQHVGTVSGGGKEGEALRGVPQHAATILAMTAASTAAVDGSVDGILGADPRLVETLCDKLCDIFRSHGAVRLQGPLLRPRDSNDPIVSLNKPVELLSRRGSVMNLREDLTINFARAVSRGGSSTSNLKRFDINKAFIESDADLHPKEMLMASFDIIQDEYTAKSEFVEAELMLVLCRVMSLLTPKEDKIYEFPPIVVKSPVWYLKLTHTRLSDAILDLLMVPTSEAIRLSCLSIFTTLTACPPIELCKHRRSGKHKRKAREIKAQRTEYVDKYLESAAAKGLPKRSGKRLRIFLSYFLTPHLDANTALDVIYDATKRIHHADVNSSHNDDVKRLSRNCFLEIIRSMSQLRQLLKAMEVLGIVPSTKLNKNDPPHFGLSKSLSYPAYISIDLGLRQKRNHFSGSLFFQAMLLHDEFFQGDGESNNRKIFGGKGTRIAEGGRYDDLVRVFRPPGNFGSVQVNDYTQCRLPICAGLVFFLGKMVERVYSDATYDEKWQGHSFVDSLRLSIGHPLIESSVPITCIVTSENGLDLATFDDRAQVASLLWSAGISCEYMAQSGVMLSILRQFWRDTNSIHEWSSSVERVTGICAILNIPFVVIVQPHLLKSKAAVKLRQTTTSTASGLLYKGNEDLVLLSSLPSFLLERLSSVNDVNDDTHLTADVPSPLTTNGESSNIQVQSHGNVEIECVYVGTDQYFDNEHRVDSAQWKHIKKVMKSSTQKMASHINDVIEQSTPVVAIDLPFRVVRDLGSSLSFDGIESLNGSEIATKYPEHKKKMRSLMYALDGLARKDHSRCNVEGKKEMRLFLYSIPCDKYDLITFAIC